MKYLKRHNIKESKKDKEFDKDTIDFLQTKVAVKDEHGRTKQEYAIPRQTQGAWMIQNHTMDKDNDLFFFVARPTFKKKEGSDDYRKSWEIETLFKMDREKPDVSVPEMMKIRAHSQGDESKVYYLWIQRDLLKELTDSEDDSSIFGNELEDFVIDTIMQKAMKA